jgi:hypothetical protein
MHKTFVATKPCFAGRFVGWARLYDQSFEVKSLQDKKLVCSQQQQRQKQQTFSLH